MDVKNLILGTGPLIVIHYASGETNMMRKGSDFLLKDEILLQIFRHLETEHLCTVDAKCWMVRIRILSERDEQFKLRFGDLLQEKYRKLQEALKAYLATNEKLRESYARMSASIDKLRRRL